MSGTELMEYVKNPTKIKIIHRGVAQEIPIRYGESFAAKTVNSSYLMAVKHAFDRIDINFMSGVDNQTTLNEFKQWIKELEDGRQ